MKTLLSLIAINAVFMVLNAIRLVTLGADWFQVLGVAIPGIACGVMAGAVMMKIVEEID